ncbi:hypothetical protein G7Z17_g209 [Cylindrodendrum hubeiense]|uniref:Uncharacterized protein n=1 Tax=Cylindrodendrum hubeiense TaxID=595255 RepID=A0A9P5HKP4_9HYPO|nr:hypothetical protein G7Z17_g209 [Cylindrodendrum hubeiense]
MYFANANADSERDEDDDDDDDDVDDDDEDCYTDNDVLQTDPLTKGAFDANMPLQDPWVYFWAVFETRIVVVNAEWKIVVKNAQVRIKTYDLVARELSSIRESFKDMGKCVRKLDCLRGDCDNFSKGLALYMTEEANRGSKAQAEFARIGVTMTIVMLLPLSHFQPPHNMFKILALGRFEISVYEQREVPQAGHPTVDTRIPEQRQTQQVHMNTRTCDLMIEFCIK